jgi:hypothetical protein
MADKEKQPEAAPIDSSKPAEEVKTPQPIDQSDAPEGTVIVNKEKFDDIMQRLERVESASDQNRLARYDSQQDGPVAYTVVLPVWDKKVVLGWGKMPKNDVGKTPQGHRYENQTLSLILEDGTNAEVPLIEFVQTKESIRATIEETHLSNDGSRSFDLITDDGKQFKKVHEKFVNV